MNTRITSRRDFMRTALLSGLGLGLAGPRLIGAPTAPTSTVSLMHGTDRADNIYRALQVFRDSIALATRGKRIVIKPNCVLTNHDGWKYNGITAKLFLSDSDVAQLEGILEFFMSIGRRDIVVVEASATGPTIEAYDNLGYLDLKRRYPVQFRDINQEDYKVFDVHSGVNRPRIRFCEYFWNEDVYMVSAPKIKTHNNAIATLSLKNVAIGAPLIDLTGAERDKGTMHGESNQDLHDNMYLMAKRGLQPDLAVIDGFEGMEGNGPNHGNEVPQQIAIASTDWLAADRVALELMQVSNAIESRGYDAQLPAYLEYCGQAGFGEWDLNKIAVVGESISAHAVQYALHDELDEQVNLNPLRPDARGLAFLNNKPARYVPALNGFWS